MPKITQPVVLIILDGWGINPKKEGNAIAFAKLPVYNSLLKNILIPHLTPVERQSACLTARWEIQRSAI